MATHPELTDEEAAFIYYLADAWLSDCAESREDTIDDPTISTAEEMLVLVQGIDDQERMCRIIMEKMHRVRS
jgi:hypothetical protein